jgi:hypothetical protein
MSHRPALLPFLGACSGNAQESEISSPLMAL